MPVVLACGHTFCRECLEGWAAKSDIVIVAAGGGGSGVSCPTCRTVCSVAVEDLPINYGVLDGAVTCAAATHARTHRERERERERERARARARASERARERERRTRVAAAQIQRPDPAGVSSAGDLGSRWVKGRSNSANSAAEGRSTQRGERPEAASS